MVSDAAKKKKAAKKQAAGSRVKAPAAAAAATSASQNASISHTTDGEGGGTESFILADGGVVSSNGAAAAAAGACVVFPAALTPRQRAAIHELAEQHSLRHSSAGDDASDAGRRVSVWLPSATPAAGAAAAAAGLQPQAQNDTATVDLPCGSEPMTDEQLAAAVKKFLGLDLSLTSSSTGGHMQNGSGTAARKKKGAGGGALAPPPPSSSLPDVRDVAEFVARMSPLITMEKDAEMALATETAAKSSPEAAQRRGRALLNLRCADAQLGLFGKTLLVLQANKGGPGTLLPPHRFTPHDVVCLRPNKSDSGKPPLGQGVVYRVRDDSIVVSVDDIPEDGLNTPLRIEKLTNDVTYKRLKDTLVKLSQMRTDVPNLPGLQLVPVLFGSSPPSFAKALPTFTPFNRGLDASQRDAVIHALSSRHVALIHGPPGTGKTTTVVEIILQEVLKRSSKVLVCAASNIAVDNLVERVTCHKGVKAVRIGHPARLLPSVLDASLDALVQKTDNSALAKDMRKDMQQLNGKIMKTKDRRERNDLRRELRQLGKEERQRQQRAVEDVLKDSNVVLTTLTGALSRHLEPFSFDLVVIDEAAQALEVACWIALMKGPRCLLAGDHLQLPPTVQSEEAEKRGLSTTLFERLARLYGEQVTSMLTVQYRMHESIMQWSSDELYEGKLVAFDGVAGHKLTDLPGVKSTPETDAALVLIDTAGCSMDESKEEDGASLLNEGEAKVVVGYVAKLLEAGVAPTSIGVITPYSAQVGLLKSMQSDNRKMAGIEISTVDGFQGREKEAIVISMVRSNDSREVGFLSDRRRMNVAVTRARRQCCIICDSGTVRENKFLDRLLEFFETNGELLSAMEFAP